MKTVLKWTILVDDEWHPVGAGPVLHVASQFGKISEVQVDRGGVRDEVREHHLGHRHRYGSLRTG